MADQAKVILDQVEFIEDSRPSLTHLSGKIEVNKESARFAATFNNSTNEIKYGTESTTLLSIISEYMAIEKLDDLEIIQEHLDLDKIEEQRVETLVLAFLMRIKLKTG